MKVPANKIERSWGSRTNRYAKWHDSAARKKEDAVNITNLAEHIILQCIEDLWDEEERGDSRHFFKGDRFHLCAEMANMSLHDQSELLNMVSKIIERTTRAKRKHKSMGEKATCFTVQVGDRKKPGGTPQYLPMSSGRANRFPAGQMGQNWPRSNGRTFSSLI
jgi:hypothetical protein